MLDLGLTRKQLAFQKQLQHFVDTEILPVARENDLKHHLLVFAKTNPEAGHKGISAFVLKQGMKVLDTRDIKNKLGLWSSSTGEIFMKNVQVPPANLVGREGEGFKIAMYALDMGRFTVAAGALGTIRACLEHSVNYAKEIDVRQRDRSEPIRPGDDREDGFKP
jgi:alkylation response protein AidB-like acyl-CoA dehydrogenase